MIADHTLTPVALRGQGIATALVEHMVADARREGFKIRPTCPFVVALFDHRPEWSDLRADKGSVPSVYCFSFSRNIATAHW